MFYYTLYNLRVISEFCLPGIQPVAVTDNYDVSVRNGFLTFPQKSKSLDSAFHYFRSDDDFFLLVKDVGIFKVDGGNKITVNPLTDDLSAVSLFLLGSCFGMLLLQREILCLHAGAVVDQSGQNSFLFLGPSGVGKSSLITFFHRNGLKILGDDVIPLQIDDDKILATSSISRVKLWENSVTRELIQDEKGIRIREDLDKYMYMLPAETHENKYGVKTLFILNWVANGDAPITFRKLDGPLAWLYLRENIYRYEIMDQPKDFSLIFNLLSFIEKKVPVYLIEGSRNLNSLNRILDEIKH